MRLPIQIMQRIIGHPVAHFSGSGHKRALGRVAVKARATLYPLQGDLIDNPFSVTLSDISAETAGLTSPRAMMPHSSMILSIPLSGEEEEASVAIRCRVTRCTRMRDGRFNIAAQFLGLCKLEQLISRMKSVS
jgi:hypothetical protein